MHTIPRVISSVAAVCLLAACGSDSVTGATSIAGTYNLQTVNGSALPFTLLQSSTSSVSLLSESPTLNANGTYSSTGTQRITVNGASTNKTTTCNGTYVLAGTKLTTTGTAVEGTQCGGTTVGTWDGANKITLTSDGPIVAVYTR